MFTVAAHMSRRTRPPSSWFVRFTGSRTMRMKALGEYEGSDGFVCSYDGGRTWQNMPLNQEIPLNGLESGLCVRTGVKRSYPSLCDEDGLPKYAFSFASDDQVTVSGFLYSLVILGKLDTETAVAPYAFANLFSNCPALVDAHELNIECPPHYDSDTGSDEPKPEPKPIPAYGMYRMFYGCPNLKTPPASVTAPEAGPYAFAGMFDSCKALTTAPNIMCQAVGEHSCESMFYGCSSLADGPKVLSAEYAPEYAYAHMFQGCSSLKATPDLRFIRVSERSCSHMFADCTSIRSVTLHPTELKENSGSYLNMFSGCKSLSFISTRQLSFNGCTGWVYDVAPSGTFNCEVGVLKSKYPNMDPETEESHPILMGSSYAPVHWTQGY